VEKDSDRIKPVERLMAHSIGSFTITKASMTNLRDSTQPFSYQWSFVALNYAKLAEISCWSARAWLAWKPQPCWKLKEPRKYPIEFPGPRHDHDAFEITLPPATKWMNFPLQPTWSLPSAATTAKPPRRETFYAIRVLSRLNSCTCPSTKWKASRGFIASSATTNEAPPS
jgi:hypothetical protein